MKKMLSQNFRDCEHAQSGSIQSKILSFIATMNSSAGSTTLMASPISVVPSQHCEDESLLAQLLGRNRMISYAIPFDPVPSMYSTPMSSIYSQPAVSNWELDCLLINPLLASSVTPISTSLPLAQHPFFAQPNSQPALLASPIMSAIPETESTDSSAFKLELTPPLSFTTLLESKLPNEPGMSDIVEAMKTPISQNLRHKRATARSDRTNKLIRFKPEDSETTLLVTIFEKNAYPSRGLRERIAEHLGLNMRQVQLWFQNKRASVKATTGVTFERPARKDSVGSGVTI